MSDGQNFVFSSLRTSFFHDTCEVRAGGLRACRYILKNNEALEAFFQIKLQFLVSRSLDILLDNRMERIQALRLIRKILCLNPDKFPRAFTNCLVSIISEGMQERDMLRPCLATVAQLSKFNFLFNYVNLVVNSSWNVQNSLFFIIHFTSYCFLDQMYIISI